MSLTGSSWASRVESPVGSTAAGSLRVSKSLIEPVLAHPRRIRNVCILAHVDHGKTTLTDSLLASNGIISFKQAGTLRYLDSREDEQERGITMQASAITLLYDAPMELGSVERHAINLIDSPGHVDFSRQVVTAARLVDGCLVLVDAVEGVCTQTMAVLRQARRERLTPCLVINKIDRLINELMMSTSDAATWLFRLLEQVNAVQAMIRADDNEDEDVETFEARMEETDKQESLMFNPLKGNVVFASSTDGWAFTIEKFVQIYSKKLDMKAAALRQTLWGEYYYDVKNKKVLSKKAAEKQALTKQMFAQFCLDPIWSLYDACLLDWNDAKIEKIALQVDAKLAPRELKTKNGRAVLRTILGQWLPLAETIFGVIVDHIPSPLQSNKIRLASIIKTTNILPPLSQAIVEKLACPDHQGSEPVVVFVSKFFSVPWRQARGSSAPSRASSMEDLTEAFVSLDTTLDPQKEKLVGMARIFHGSLSVGQKVYILRENHLPGMNEVYQEHIISELYLLMGRDLEPIETVHTGSIFGIGGIGDFLVKSGTLSSDPACPLLEATRGEIAPIVQVAIRPSQLENMCDMVAGLKLLCQADPCAETFLQEENGEHILAVAGELHLEQCLKDLRERFTKSGADLIVSSPMVPYRETISEERNRNEDMWKMHIGPDDSVREKDGLITLTTMDERCRIGARAFPMSGAVTHYLVNNRARLRDAYDGRLSVLERANVQTELDGLLVDIGKHSTRSNLYFLIGLETRDIWALGPRRDGPNLLFCRTKRALDSAQDSIFYRPDATMRQCESSILTGFQVLTEKGPLAHEPMMGVAFAIESFELVSNNSDEAAENSHQEIAQVSRQLISLSKTLFEAAFLFWSPRIMLAVYRCSIQTTAEMLGRVYSALGRRHGRVVSEDYYEGTGFFTVNSRLPVAESFGFADDLRGRTAGIAIPQLVFAGFETLPEDPYWAPSTEEELEDHGVGNEAAENLAMRHLVRIRERKGLFVERKTVQFAVKLRTLRK